MICGFQRFLEACILHESLKLSWNNARACEQLGNHFKFVGTDL